MFSPLADLDRYAIERPDALALTTPGAHYSFADLKTTVDAVAIRLRTEGVKPRDIVGVDLSSALEWIVDLALLRLATRSVSLRGVAQLGGLGLDVLIAEPGGRTELAPTVIRVDELWMSSAVSSASGAVPAVEYPRPDSIFRLMLTSGTTGTPRAAAYSVGALEHRRAGLGVYWSDGRPELNFMGLSTTGGLHTAIANLQHGQAHRAINFINERTLRFAADQRVQVICGSPAQIASALDVMAQHSIELPDLAEIRMAGASPSSTLMRLIDKTLGVAVRSVYGSTEGGGVTMRMLRLDDDLADVGPALPSLELQIVDETGTPVADGTEGLVRYRGAGMVSGYLQGGTLEPFARGWFEPGDVGMLSPTGSLVLGGRTAEIVNVAGHKINPALVDSTALEFAGVTDAASFGIERENGIAELAIAIVAEASCDLRALDQFLRRQLGQGFPTAFWRVAEIPRNRMGKVERAVLAQAFARTTTRG